jgi:hypothetical protein
MTTWHNLSIGEAVKQLDASPAGLTEAEATDECR